MSNNNNNLVVAMGKIYSSQANTPEMMVMKASLQEQGKLWVFNGQFKVLLVMQSKKATTNLYNKYMPHGYHFILYAYFYIYLSFFAALQNLLHVYGMIHDYEMTG